MVRILDELIVQKLNVNITSIIDRSYTCTNDRNKCFEFVLNEKIFMIYLINNEYFLTELKLNGSFFNEIDILDKVTIEEIKTYLNNDTIASFVNNSKQFEQLVLNNTYKEGMHTIEALFHNTNNTFNYSIDKVETNQIINLKSVKSLKNIDEILEAVKC